MRKILFLLFILSFSSCRSCQQWKRSVQTSDRDYDISVYSGGKCVYHDKFHGLLNQEDSTDGLYYFKGDTLIELSGAYVVKSKN